MPDFWVSDKGARYHGWEGCGALEAERVPADSQEGYERRAVRWYDSEDAARAAAKEHARCEAHACFARGRGAGLARLSVQVLKALDDSKVPPVRTDESALADQGCGDADEGEEVFGLAFVAAAESAAADQPGHRPFDDPAVASQPCR